MWLCEVCSDWRSGLVFVQKGVPFAKQNNLALFPFPEQGFPALIFTCSGAESGGARRPSVLSD
jgi:hypothetical protein